MDHEKEILAGFYSDPGHLNKILSLTGPEYQSRATAFITAIKEYGIEHSAIVLDNFAIFSHKKLAQIIEKFTKDNPLEALPVEHITIVQYAGATTYTEDLKQTLSSLQKHSEQMAHFSSRWNIDITVNIYLQGLDLSSAISICELAQSRSLDSLGFFLDLDLITEESASTLKTALTEFLKSPYISTPKIRFGNFPFCLFPADKFKLLYRDAIDPLKGSIGSQRAWIEELGKQTFTYHQPCRSCRCRVPCYTLTRTAECEDMSFAKPRFEKTLAFVGGSLPPEDRPDDEDIVWTSPAEQGDILTAVLEGFENILIIDGYFYSKFPCTTFEVMIALEHEINIFGSSSIGALRAVELDEYGMTGIGDVYERLKKTEIKPYHIVAQTYNEDNSALTIPLVQILYFLDMALDGKIISDQEHAEAANIAEDIHFTLLSFNYFFRLLHLKDSIPQPTAERLEKYYSDTGPAVFDVKRKDALRLLGEYRTILNGRQPDYVHKCFMRKRDEALNLLHRKYGEDRNRSLPAGWQGTGDPAKGGNMRDNRSCPASETCANARAFLDDMGILLADTTRYDQADSLIISAFYIPFYYLTYYPSSATGNGDVFDEAMASAYMELVERIPSCFLMRATGVHNTRSTRLFPVSQVPQYYNWNAEQNVKQDAIRKNGLIQVSDIVSGYEFIIPAFSIMFYYSGTDGNASGNTLEEAILYGLYEIVERDTCQIHVSSPDCRRYLSALMINRNAITDERALKLLRQFEEKGCRVVVFLLPNQYGLPCVMCHVYDNNRRIQCHGSVAVRADFNAALTSALHEAYMQYITYFVGTRDDYRSLAPTKQSRIAYENAQALYAKDAGIDIAPTSKIFGSVSRELDGLTRLLTEKDIRNILIADMSPEDTYKVKSVKVIVPGMELWFCPAYTPSPYFAHRAERTLTAIKELVK